MPQLGHLLVRPSVFNISYIFELFWYNIILIRLMLLLRSAWNFTTKCTASIDCLWSCLIQMLNFIPSLIGTIKELIWYYIKMIRNIWPIWYAGPNQQMPKLRHANIMPTHAFTMHNTGVPPVLSILLACVGIMLACLSLGICWLGLAYWMHCILCLASSDPGFVVDHFALCVSMSWCH